MQNSIAVTGRKMNKMKNNIFLILYINGSGGANTMGLSVPSGIFFARIKTAENSQSRKMLFLK
jgi:hypothetical protein